MSNRLGRNNEHCGDPRNFCELQNVTEVIRNYFNSLNETFVRYERNRIDPCLFLKPEISSMFICNGERELLLEIKQK